MKCTFHTCSSGGCLLTQTKHGSLESLPFKTTGPLPGAEGAGIAGTISNNDFIFVSTTDLYRLENPSVGV